jgi:hypothetical protein
MFVNVYIRVRAPILEVDRHLGVLPGIVTNSSRREPASYLFECQLGSSKLSALGLQRCLYTTEPRGSTQRQLQHHAHTTTLATARAEERADLFRTRCHVAQAIAA